MSVPCCSGEGAVAESIAMGPEEAKSFSFMAPLAVALNEIREVSGELPFKEVTSKIKSRVKCCPKCCLWQRCYACLGKNVTSERVVSVLGELKEQYGGVVLGMAVSQWCADPSCKRVSVEELKAQLDSFCVEALKQLNRIFCCLQDAVKKARRASRPNLVLGTPETITYAICQCSGLFDTRLDYGNLVDKVKMVGELCQKEPLSEIWSRVEDSSSLLDPNNVKNHLLVSHILFAILSKQILDQEVEEVLC